MWKDKNGEELKPGDTVKVLIGSDLHDGVVVTEEKWREHRGSLEESHIPYKLDKAWSGRCYWNNKSNMITKMNNSKVPRYSSAGLRKGEYLVICVSGKEIHYGEANSLAALAEFLEKHQPDTNWIFIDGRLNTLEDLGITTKSKPFIKYIAPEEKIEIPEKSKIDVILTEIE